MTTSGPLIFLDIDGVLRRTGAPVYLLEDDLRRTFEETLRAMPGAEIVISSSWREGFSLTEHRWPRTANTGAIAKSLRT